MRMLQLRILFVGVTGFEPVTFSLSGRCSNQTELYTYIAESTGLEPVPQLRGGI